MTNTEWSALRCALIENYDELIRRLTRKFKSRDLAYDALQNTYLRIEKGGEIGPVTYPLGYVLQIATNQALVQRRSERRLTASEIETALDIADDAPGPAQAAEARSSVAKLERALAQLPPRRRAIFLAAWRDHLPPREIARRFDLSTRKIFMELKLAREYCIDVLGEG